MTGARLVGAWNVEAVTAAGLRRSSVVNSLSNDRVLRLVDADRTASWKLELRHRSPASFLNLGTVNARLRKPLHLTGEVIAHEVQLRPGSVGRVYRELRWRQIENQPAATRIDVVEAERVGKERAIGVCVAAEDDDVRTEDHRRSVPQQARPRKHERRYSCEVRPLRYSINVTLDGCCDHRAIPADEELHRHAAESISQNDALLFGRVTYEMMESAFRPPAGTRPEYMEPFAQTINAAKKYVVSSTLRQVNWNAELVHGDLGKAVQQLKQESGNGLGLGGVQLPMALAELGLIDEYEFVVHPRIAGHGPSLFAGLSKHVDLKLVSRLEFDSGAVAMRYEPSR